MRKLKPWKNLNYISFPFFENCDKKLQNFLTFLPSILERKIAKRNKIKIGSTIFLFFAWYGKMDPFSDLFSLLSWRWNTGHCQIQFSTRPNCTDKRFLKSFTVSFWIQIHPSPILYSCIHEWNVTSQNIDFTKRIWIIYIQNNLCCLKFSILVTLIEFCVLIDWVWFLLV